MVPRINLVIDPSLKLQITQGACRRDSSEAQKHILYGNPVLTCVFDCIETFYAPEIHQKHITEAYTLWKPGADLCF